MGDEGGDWGDGIEKGRTRGRGLFRELPYRQPPAALSMKG